METNNSKSLMHYLSLSSTLVFSLGFIYLVFEKVENSKKVKVPFPSLILFLVASFIQFVLALNPQVEILYKIFGFLTFISVVLIILAQLRSNTEKYCNKGKPYVLSPEYEDYYKKVMKRNQYDLIQPYKDAFQNKL